MVNKVVPFDKLEDECMEWAYTMMERSPLAIRMIKAGLNAELDGWYSGTRRRCYNAVLFP